VGVDTWGGFVFVNLTPSEAQPLATQLGGIPERLRRYPLAQLRIGSTMRYDVAANWKIICENYNECYHCGGVHPELCAVVPSFREGGGANLDWSRGVPHREGAYTFTHTGTTLRRAFAGLNEDEKVRHKGELAYPNLFLSVACDHVAAYILKPRSADRTQITCHFLFETHEIEKPAFDPSDTVDFWDLVNRQDWTVCEAVQEGIRARVHTHGYFAPMEDYNLDIRRYVRERVGPFMHDMPV
jgi:Rieske 2Fe-2S family protein